MTRTTSVHAFNFLWVHPAAKLILTYDMLAGRLELVTLMIIFTPAFWRR